MHQCEHRCLCVVEDQHEKAEDLYYLVSKIHSDALIANYRFTLTTSQDDTRERLETLLLKIGTAVNNWGGYIGHIKASVLFEQYGYYLSLTDKTVDKVECQDLIGKVEGVAIVFGIEEWQLLNIMKDCLAVAGSFHEKTT